MGAVTAALAGFSLPEAERRELCAAAVTLDGKRAKICGVRNDFATVATLPNGPRYEWAWSTVRRIVAAGGAFRS